MQKKGLRLYCFSPPVMIATFIIEIALLVYTVVRYRLTPITRLIAVLIILLATFQLAEYNVCESISITTLWSRIGYVAITLLPAVGLHLIMVIAGRKSRWLVWLSYCTAFAFALVFGLSSTAFANYVCTGNYVIFRLAPSVGGIFFSYYYLWLSIGIFISLYYARSASRPVQKALILQVVGYMCFLVPTGIVNTINPQTISGIPSVMCGFAVLYALILGFGIAPLVLPKRSKPLS